MSMLSYKIFLYFWNELMKSILYFLSLTVTSKQWETHLLHCTVPHCYMDSQTITTCTGLYVHCTVHHKIWREYLYCTVQCTVQCSKVYKTVLYRTVEVYTVLYCTENYFHKNLYYYSRALYCTVQGTVYSTVR